MKIYKNKFILNSNQNIEIFNFIKKMITDKSFINGKTVRKFESSFSKKINSKYCVGFSSSSTSISSIMNLLCKKNDEILIPAFSPLPVALALKNYNLNFRFIDVDLETFLMSFNLINYLKKNTKIIMPVHLFGNVFNVTELKKNIKKDIYIIEDSSQAHFSKIDGSFAGTKGLASIFSFYPTKNLNAFGDAGCVVTNNYSIYNQLSAYRNYGLHKKINKLINYGNNFRMDEIQAKIILINLDTIILNNYKRSIVAKKYINRLKDLPIKFQKINDNVETNNHVFSIIVSSKIRDKLNIYLKKNGIETEIYYKTLLPRYLKNYTTKFLKENFPNSYHLSKSIINLPIHPYLKEIEIDFICERVNHFFKNK